MSDKLATSLAWLPLVFSRNKLSHTIDAANPELTSRVGLKYFLEIQTPEFPMSPTFKALHRSEGREKPLDPTTGVTVYEGAEFVFNDLKGKIDGQLSLVKPNAGQKRLSLSVTQTLPFRLREIIEGGQLESPIDITGAPRWAIKAGLSPEHVPGYQNDFFSVYQAKKRQFLTWQPAKTIGKKEELYLSFVLNCSPVPDAIKLRYRYTNSAGKTIGPFTAQQLETVVQYAVVVCPVGPVALDLPADTTRYQVWLSNQENESVSEVRTYQIDQAYRPFERYILFSNSLGGWDTLRFIGKSSGTLKINQVTAERTTKPSDPLDTPQLLTVSTEGEQELVVSTGYFQKDAAVWVKYLDELLFSEEIYLVTEHGHEPLQRITSQLINHQDDVFLQARSFQFTKQASVQNFSSLPANQPSSRLTTWQGQDYSHVLDAFGKRTGKMAARRIRKIYADDGTDFKPFTIKPNTPGDPDYIAPLFFPDVEKGSTPYPSKAITRRTTFNRTNCGGNYVGGPALVVIEAGKYGGESEGTADALAEAEYAANNTQAYANQFGTCDNTPQNYAYDVPAGHWHYRTNVPSSTLVCEGGIDLKMGNAWFLQSQNKYRYPSGSNDLDFPAPATGWRFGFYYPSSIQVKLWVNGQVVHQQVFQPNGDNYGQFHYPGSFQSEDRVYVERISL